MTYSLPPRCSSQGRSFTVPQASLPGDLLLNSAIQGTLPYCTHRGYCLPQTLPLNVRPTLPTPHTATPRIHPAPHTAVPGRISCSTLLHGDISYQDSPLLRDAALLNMQLFKADFPLYILSYPKSLRAHKLLHPAYFLPHSDTVGYFLISTLLPWDTAHSTRCSAGATTWPHTVLTGIPPSQQTALPEDSLIPHTVYWGSFLLPTLLY